MSLYSILDFYRLCYQINCAGWLWCFKLGSYQMCPEKAMRHCALLALVDEMPDRHCAWDKKFMISPMPLPPIDKSYVVCICTHLWMNDCCCSWWCWSQPSSLPSNEGIIVKFTVLIINLLTIDFECLVPNLCKIGRAVVTKSEVRTFIDSF